MATDDDALTSSSQELPVRSKSDVEPFDIVKTYHRLLADDPELTMPVAAIEALIEALGASSATTIFETMSLVVDQSETLRKGVANPVALSHGTALFRQYLSSAFTKPGPNGEDTSSHEDFEVVRQHLLGNGRLFVARAKEAREKIAAVGRPYIRQNSTILTHGGSRVVRTLLEKAAEPSGRDQKRGFKVIYAIQAARRAESLRVVDALRAKGIKVAMIPESAVAHVMTKVNMVLVGAEAVTANGGIISRIGTYQIAQLAKNCKKPFYVAAEQQKFGTTQPLTQFNLGFKQDILDFNTNATKEDEDDFITPSLSHLVDFTPSDLITTYFSNHGVRSPLQVAAEIIETFY